MNTYIKKIDVLTPSAGSLALSVGGLIAGIIFLIIPQLGGNFIPELLFGKSASEALTTSDVSQYGEIIQGIFNNDFVGQTVVFATWMFIGLCVFVLLSVLSHVFSELNNERRKLSDSKQNKNTLLRSAFTMLAFKLVVAAVWAGLLMIGLRFVVSYFAITGFVAIAGGGMMDWLTFLLACIILMLGIHLQVVMLRLLVGRVRLWQ